MKVACPLEPEGHRVTWRAWLPAVTVLGGALVLLVSNQVMFGRLDDVTVELDRNARLLEKVVRQTGSPLPDAYPPQRILNGPLELAQSAHIAGLLCSEKTVEVVLNLSWSPVDQRGKVIPGSSVTVVSGARQLRQEGCEWHGPDGSCPSDARCLPEFVNPMPPEVIFLASQDPDPKRCWIIQGSESVGSFSAGFRSDVFAVNAPDRACG